MTDYLPRNAVAIGDVRDLAARLVFRAGTPKIEYTMLNGIGCPGGACNTPGRDTKGSALVFDQSIIARFWNKVDKSAGPLGCWLWLAQRDRFGYGRFTPHRPHKWYAHRFAYAITRGAIPDGLIVCHSCDNPSCVNPAHLWVGTVSDNARDAFEKGRMVQQRDPSKIARGERNCMNRHPELRRPGEKNPMAKLSADQVREIRRLRAGGMSFPELVLRFPVGDTQLRQVCRGTAWAHVLDE